MIRVSSLKILAAILPAIAIAAAAPAHAAKVSPQKGMTLCKSAAEAQTPGAKVRIDRDEYKATSSSLKYVVYVKPEGGEQTKINCVVEYASGAVSLEGAPVSLQAVAPATTASAN
jgi:hypothetical protein